MELPSDEWDPSLPGAGAERATAIAQLYFRMAGYSPLTIVVADALLLVFGSNGASVSELVDYMGLSDERIQRGIDSIAPGMRCTSLEVQRGGLRGGAYPGDDSQQPSERRKEALRHYINYKVLVPAAYAHLTHLLLALCVSPLPVSTEAARALSRRREVLDRGAPCGAPSPTQSEDAKGGGPEHPRFPTGGDPKYHEPSLLRLSPALRQSEAAEGVFCRVCQFYSAPHELATTLSKCPTCGADVLRNLVEALRDRCDQKCEAGESLVCVRDAAVPARAGETPSSPVDGSLDAPTRGSASSFPEGLNCPLSRDPFVLQQALVFFSLFSVPFACLNDAAHVVDVEDMLTEAEYEYRVKGKATVADHFRAVHRHTSSIRVRLVSQKMMDAAKREENEIKIKKRACLPPWLRSRSALDETGGGHTSTQEGLLSFRDPALRGTESVPKGGTHAADASPSRTKKRVRSAPGSGEGPQPIHSIASFVAREFLEDDYDAVPLPLHRLQRWEGRA